MEVCYRTKKLQKHYEIYDEAKKAYGESVGEKYVQRINIIKQAKDIEELRSLPVLKCHPLIGNRKGEWAVKLTGKYRLIFTLKGEFLEIVCIEEVSPHYDD